MTIGPLTEETVDAWNPGIKSTLPPEYLPLSSIFRPENVFTSVETARELSDFTGLTIYQVIRLRPQRLVVHELLIRVSADIFVSDGSKYEDLGVNFRKVVATILEKYIEPEMERIVGQFNELENKVRKMVETELDASLFNRSASNKIENSGFSWKSLFTGQTKAGKKDPPETQQMRDQRILANWSNREQAEVAGLDQALYQALTRIANAIIIKHGRLIGDKKLLVSLVAGLVCNQYGSRMIGELISPMIHRAALAEGYRILPTQQQPVVINVKGASASGKSTMRPLQKKHTEKLGISWQDFALISPDIWRKYLLDYDSLGPARKYAGTLAGAETPIVDEKFDLYINDKARQGRLSHMLIDRFRFNCFTRGSDTEQGSNLLTRFGHTVYLVFLVTPPEATVERAWIRGLQVGRYKPVDDLLDHNIEAFNGIPDLFFTWALHKDKIVYYEFLDNGVPYGEMPRTIAFGLNGEMYILDFKSMFDIVRYTKINIEAAQPEAVYPHAGDMERARNTDFLVKCTRKIPRVNFVDFETSCVYACMESGKMSWVDAELMSCVLDKEDEKAGFEAIAPGLIAELASVPHQQARPLSLEETRHTMGVIDGPTCRI